MAKQKQSLRGISESVETMLRTLGSARPAKYEEDHQLKKRFGERLRVIRQAAKMGQELLGARCRVGRAQISNLELGNSFPSWPLFYRLANALGVQPEELLP